MISSIRFRNSGRNASRSRGMIRSRSGSSLGDGTLPEPLSVKPSGRRPIVSEPRLLVMITTVFLKSTVRPCPSVSRPSSSTCSRMLNTSACAFSISSSSSTAYGVRRTASVSCPASS